MNTLLALIIGFLAGCLFDILFFAIAKASNDADVKLFLIKQAWERYKVNHISYYEFDQMMEEL